MDDKLPYNAQTHREDSFDITVRGYNRQQVLEYMSRSSQLLASLEQNLAVARADVQRARAEAERAEAEAARLRAAQVEAKPVHEEVSERLSQILRLAAEEADQDRATATAEIAKLREDSQAESERLVNEARAEAEQELAQARATAEQELAQAHEIAEQELAQARAQADEDLQAAREEADRIRSNSEEQSTELLEEAARRAAAVNEVSDQRLDTLTATHGEAVLRLGQIRDVLADLLDRDAAAGSLSQVVDAVVAPSRRPEIDTRPELEDGLDQEQDFIDVDEVEPPTGQDDDESADPDDAAVRAEAEEAEPEAEVEAEPDAEADAERETEPEAESTDPDQTSIVPPVAPTAVHQPIQAEVRRDEDIGPNGTLQIKRVEDEIVQPIDLRDQPSPVEREIPTRR